jgi:hypothetical protein
VSSWKEFGFRLQLCAASGPGTPAGNPALCAASGVPGLLLAGWLAGWLVLVCRWQYLSSSAIEGEEERETRNERVGKDRGASMYGRAMSNRSGAVEQHTVKLEQVPRWIEQERLSPTASSSLSDGGSDRDFLDPLTSGTMIPQSFSPLCFLMPRPCPPPI